MSDFANYRRDLAVLDPVGSRAPQIQHNPPSTASSFMQQVAPWMTGGGTGAAAVPPPGSSNGTNGGNHSNSPASTSGNGTVVTTTFYNDDSDNLSSASQMSPGFRSASVSALMRPTQNPPGSDSPDAAFFNDERRPSVASITTTASSQASKSSGHRGGLRKLQGFFGEEYPGRDSSETSLPPSYAGKESRSHSYSHTPRPHRDRNHSNATDHTRDASPASSRPRTPVPAPEVVPFLYQEAEVRIPFLKTLACTDPLWSGTIPPYKPYSLRSLCHIRFPYVELELVTDPVHCNSTFTPFLLLLRLLLLSHKLVMKLLVITVVAYFSLEPADFASR